MKLYPFHAADTPGYAVWRWWPYAGEYENAKLQGAYFLISKNNELAYMQGATSAHVICIVDDFGTLVRKP